MKYAIIDTMALCYSAKFTTGNLNNGVIYGFIRYLLTLQKKFNFDQFLFCFDSRSSKRKEIYPDYKGNRKDINSRALIYSQFDIIQREILPQIGFRNLFQTTGLEADDIIGSLCIDSNPDDEYIIISRDNDLYQLLDKNILQYDYVSKKIITKRLFIDKFGIDPKQYGIVKSITGCKSDNVEGISGIGEKTAIKYLNNELNLSRALGKIETNHDIIDRNKSLVVLPFENTPQYRITEDKLNFKSLTKIFIEYNFASQLIEKIMNDWSENFDWIDVKQRKTKLSDFF